jgi:hypothetical protein
MWTLIGTYNYILYSGDTSFLTRNIDKYTKALAWISEKLNRKALMDVTGLRDWARWNSRGENAAGNVLLLHTIETALRLADWSPDLLPTVSRTYLPKASALRAAINQHLWDDAAGALWEATGNRTIHPQDANALAILYGAIDGARARAASTRLTRNWTPIGPEPPELPGNVSPFISGFELQAHLSLRDTARGPDLLRRVWGWYMAHEQGTQSTMIEGYRTDGSFGYRAERGYGKDASSYVSHAHGWSTGATSALTNYVAGLQVTGKAAVTWSVKPQFGMLRFAEAGFMTPRGRLRTRWERVGEGYNVLIEAPLFTTGDVLLPTVNRGFMDVLINGTKPPDLKEGLFGLETKLPGGFWNITVRPMDRGIRKRMDSMSRFEFADLWNGKWI